MSPAAAARAPAAIRAGYRGFLAFCEAVGFTPERFQRRIAKAALEGPRELLVLLPRGNGKSRLVAHLVVHHLLITPRPAAYVAASSREQARIVFEYARDIALELDLSDELIIRHLELRTPDGFLRVLASDAPKLHGLTPTLCVVDELQAAKDADVYLAMRSALQKRPGARLITISTAGAGAETPLGKLRRRALAADDIRRKGPLVAARGDSLQMLEWAVPDDVSIGDTRAAKQANPASWLTREGLVEQREALPELAYRRFHLNQWVAKLGSWLPAGAWQQCAGKTDFIDGERIWIGVDVGGSRADTAVVWVNERLHVGCRIWSGDDAILDAAALVPALAERYTIVEAIFDPWRAGQMAREWEQRGITAVDFPQHDARMIPASQALYDAIVEERLVHPDEPDLNAHVAAAVARHTRRGWRIDKAAPSEKIDGAIALAMAVDRATNRPPPAEFLGWL